jgi:hypothetical protein
MVYGVYDSQGHIRKTFKQDMTFVGSYQSKAAVLEARKYFKGLGHETAFMESEKERGKYVLWISTKRKG